MFFYNQSFGILSTVRRARNNLALFCKTVGTGILGIFSLFLALVSYDGRIIYTIDVPYANVIILSSAMSILIILYFYTRWDAISTEYQELHERYITWIDTLSSWKRYLASLPLNFSLSLFQFVMIWTMEVFRPHIQPEVTANVTLFLVNIINFFVLRIYLFNYRHDNYLWQGVSYTLITIGSLLLNYLAVWFFTTHDFWPIKSAIEPLIIVLGVTVMAQVLSSIIFGALPYKAHEQITFRKNGKH